MILLIKATALLVLSCDVIIAQQSRPRLQQRQTPVLDKIERFVEQTYSRSPISPNNRYENRPNPGPNSYKNIFVGDSYGPVPTSNTENRFAWGENNREQHTLKTTGEKSSQQEAYLRENDKNKPYSSWSTFNGQPLGAFRTNPNPQSQAAAWGGKYQKQHLNWGNANQKPETFKNFEPQKQVVISGDLNRQLQKSNQQSDTLEKQTSTWGINNSQQQGDTWRSPNYQQQSPSWSIGVHQKGLNEHAGNIRDQGSYWGNNNNQIHSSNNPGNNDYQSNWKRQQKRSDTSSYADYDWSNWSNKVQQSKTPNQKQLNWDDPGYQQLWTVRENYNNQQRDIFTNNENNQPSIKQQLTVQPFRSDWKNENQKASSDTDSYQGTSNLPSVQEPWWHNADLKQQNNDYSTDPETQTYYEEKTKGSEYGQGLEWENGNWNSQEGISYKPTAAATKPNWQQQPRQITIVQNENNNKLFSTTPITDKGLKWVNNIYRAQESISDSVKNEVSNKFRTQPPEQNWSWLTDAFQTRGRLSSIDNASNGETPKSNVYPATVSDENLNVDSEPQTQGTQKSNVNYATKTTNLQSAQNLEHGTNTWQQQTSDFTNNLNYAKHTTFSGKNQFPESGRDLQSNNGYWAQPTLGNKANSDISKSPEIRPDQQTLNWGSGNWRQSSQESPFNINAQNLESKPSDLSSGVKNFNQNSNFQTDQTNFDSGSWLSHLNAENLNIKDQTKSDRFIVGQAFVNELLGLHPLSDLSETHAGHSSFPNLIGQRSGLPASLPSAKDLTPGPPLTQLAAQHLVKSIGSSPTLAMDRKLEILRQLPFQGKTDGTLLDNIKSNSRTQPLITKRNYTPDGTSGNPVSVMKSISFEIRDTGVLASTNPVISYQKK